MRPTRLGTKAIVFYGLLVVAFFAAPYLNLFFLLLAFASVLGTLCLWWTHRNIAGVGAVLEDLRPMPAGCAQGGHATLRTGRRPRHDLALELVVDGRRHTIAHTIHGQAGTQLRVDVMLPPLRRGEHAVLGGRVFSLFPFGIFRAWRSMPTPATILVHPAPADLAAYRDRNGTAGLGGIGGSATLEMGPAGLREFRDGDEMRQVHWKVSARRNQLVVRELEGDTTPGLEVLFDLRCECEELEEALALTTALALECRDNKELFTLRTQEHVGTYGEGHASFDALLAYLARARSLGPDGSAPPPVAPTVLRLPLRAGGAKSAAGRASLRETGA